MRNLGLILFACCFLRISSLEMGIEIFKEILNFPLRDNPFFAKVISLGDAFSGDGIEDGDSDSSGYICQTLGNLDCEDEHEPQCSGLGVIDCTPACAGTEEEFKLFMKVMEDPDFSKKYPELAKAKMGGKKEETKMDESKESDKGDMKEVEGAVEEEVKDEESKPDARGRFFAGIQTCTNFSSETMTLVSLAGGSGGGFGGDTSDPNSLTYVDPNAVSDIANIEYDYSDYYEDDEEAQPDEGTKDIGKERRNAEKDDDGQGHQISTASIKEKLTKDKPISKSHVQEVDDLTKSQMISKNDEKKMFGKVKDTSNSKTEYYKSLNNLDDINSKDLTNEEKISLNMIRSVDEDLELKDTDTMSQKTNESMKIEAFNELGSGEEKTMDDNIKVVETIISTPAAENTSGDVDETTTVAFATTEGTSEYQDDDDKLFKEETNNQETSTMESIIEQIVDIEERNENNREETKIGIDWDKLNTLKENAQMNDKADNEYTSPPTSANAKDRVKRKVDDIQELFAKSLAIAKAGNGFSNRVKRHTQSFNNEALAYRVAEKMRILLRRKRELETVGSANNMTMPDDMPCTVKNMTCVKFPSKKHCKGIAVGRCGSRTDLLAKLFTPHVVMVTIVSVLVIVVVTVGLSYYCYKLKAENRVEPEQGEEEEPKNGDIKTVEPASPGDPPPA